LLHGSGTWLQGRTVTTERLLLLEGIGLLTTFMSGLVLFETGAARDIVGPTALTAVAGVGTFGSSFLANLYATWAPAAGFGEPERRLPLLESSVGYQYVADPQFDFHHFVTTRIDARLDAVHLALHAAYAPDPGNQRIELLAGYRVIGPNASRTPARDGSYLEPQLGYSEHRFDSSGFLARTFELGASGRLDAARLLPDVRGAFFQLGAGWAKQWIVFDLPGVDAQNSTSLLLAHMGFGVYVGQRAALAPSGGEIELYYDHRHDGFAGGLKLNGLGSGAAGHLGLAGHYYLSEAWGVRALAELGSAWVLGLSALLRVGA
jgi:hypothetical protein